MNHSKLALAILLPLLFGLGFAAAFALAGATAQPAGPPAESDAQRDVALAVRSLVQQIDRLERALEAAAEVRREMPVAASHEVGGEVTRSALARDDAPRPAAETETARGERTPAASSRFALDGTTLPKQSEALVPLMGQSEEDRSRAHWFLGYQQILARYGRPDSMDVNPEGALVWIYNEAATRGQIGFTFFDGFVVRVWGGVPPRDEDRAN
jgi:hypothetical protein